VYHDPIDGTPVPDSDPVIITDEKVPVWATPSVPVLLVFWKKAAACVFERMPELDR
jgi:hypothetical protein